MYCEHLDEWAKTQGCRAPQILPDQKRGCEHKRGPLIATYSAGVLCLRCAHCFETVVNIAVASLTLPLFEECAA